MQTDSASGRTRAPPPGDPFHQLFLKSPMAMDVIGRKWAEEELRRMNETLERRVREETAKNREKDHLLIQQSRLAAMGEMIHNIAHQWRQPLSTLSLVLSNIQDAYRYGELDDDYLENETAAGEAIIKMMSSTIDDFRHFFHPGKAPEPFSLKAAAKNTLSLVGPTFDSSNIAIQFDAEDLTVYGFPSEYSQVLLNLLNNARDAITRCGVADGQIDIRIRGENGKGRIIVRDNGCGIPEDILPKIFDPYFTTQAAGTGIGLYMAKMIIEHSMGGSIEARNEGRGAEVAITVPLADNPDQGAPT